MHSAERDHPSFKPRLPLSQLWGRQTLCARLEPPVTGMLIVRYNDRKGFTRGWLGRIGVSPARLDLSRFEPGNPRGRIWLVGAHWFGAATCRRHNPAKRQDAKKPSPAKLATVGGNAEPALQGNAGSLLDTPARDSFQIEVPTFRAVCVTAKRVCNAPSVKPFVARVTSPGLVAYERREQIKDSVSM